MVLNLLHALNDGYEANFPLLLPFITRDIHITLIQVGWLSALLYVFSVILALPSGYIAVKIGGLKTLILALFVYGIGFVGVGFTGNYVQLLSMFILGGIGFGLFHPIAFALIARRSSRETRGRMMGSFSAVGDLGKIALSTLLTIIVIYIGWRKVAFLYGIGALLISVGFYFFLFRKNDVFAKKEQKPTQIGFWHIIANRQFIFAATTNIFDNFASQTLFVFLPFLLLARGFEPTVLGFFAGAFFIGNFTGRILLGRLVDKYGNTKIFIISEVLMAFFIFLLANTTPLYLIIGCALMLGAFTKGTNPIVKTMVSESVEHHGNFEKAYGINSVTSNLAVAASPLALGYISSTYGITSAFNVMAIVALLAIIPAFGFHFGKRNMV